MTVRVLEVGTMIGFIRQGPVKVAIHFLPLHIHGPCYFARCLTLQMEAQLPSYFDKMPDTWIHGFWGVHSDVTRDAELMETLTAHEFA